MSDVALRPWADLVFHVLAHVGETAHFPASVFDPAYVAFAARHAGPAESRILGEDVRVLGRVLRTHAALARAQWLAWVFRDIDAAAAAGRVLDAPGDAEGVDPEALAAARQAGPAVEVLCAAALLEREHHARLPSCELDGEPVRRALAAVAPAAPRLARFDIGIVRSLRLRGRVRGREILVGAPGSDPGPSFEHIAWQAAHEAAVAEVAACARAGGVSLGERRIEHAAIVLTAARARAAGLGAGHGAWLRHLGRNAPDPRLGALPEVARRVVRRSLAETP